MTNLTARIISTKFSPPTEFETTYNRKLNTARRHYRNGNSALVKMCAGYYVAADSDGVYEIHKRGNVWITEYTPNGDSFASDVYQSIRLLDSRWHLEHYRFERTS
ncbi:hypothetical protein LCGC14_1670370 [marine sediment metagenome]|uniref:Uncharacterized protein n=1 Tax=marine sediment metagenome TaxID=412755 RepID=A0A0F9HSD8_9ZZZZ